jgi:uncharacterized DUF497 family protein
MNSRDIVFGGFEWDLAKDISNQATHGVAFHTAIQAFSDPKALILTDPAHSTSSEIREFLVGRVGDRVLTVRFTRRDDRIRLIGAGYWRKFQKKYHAHHSQNP